MHNRSARLGSSRCNFGLSRWKSVGTRNTNDHGQNVHWIREATKTARNVVLLAFAAGHFPHTTSSDLRTSCSVFFCVIPSSFPFESLRRLNLLSAVIDIVAVKVDPAQEFYTGLPQSSSEMCSHDGLHLIYVRN